MAVCPVFPTSAPPYGFSYATMLFTTSYHVWVNLAGLPGLVVPVGRNGHGMPIGVQIIGNPGSEATLLAAGMAVQAAMFGYDQNV